MPDSFPNPRTELLADRVARVIDGWPKLTEEQISNVAAILQNGDG